MIIKQSFIKAALSLVLGASLSSFTPEILADQYRPLMAGQDTEVGYVKLSAVGNQVRVDYNITQPGWCLNTTHLYVGANPPQTNAPGKFPYAHQSLGCRQVDSYFYPNEDIQLSSCGYVAAHGVVTEWALPIGGQVTYKVSHGSYPTNIIGIFNGDILINGQWQRYLSRCVDLDHSINADGTTEYSCILYSSLDINAPVDKPANLDLLNYLINHKNDYFLVGATERDLMAVNWMLIDNKATHEEISAIFNGNYHPNLVDQIVEDIKLKGEGFIPTSTDLIGIIVKCGNKQVTLLEVPRGDIDLGSETAWAQVEGDSLLPKKGKGDGGWGTYFACLLP